MTSYVQSKLEDANGETVFSVRCPGCPQGDAWEMDDATAKKILPQDLFEVWEHHKLLNSIPKASAHNLVEMTWTLTVTLTTVLLPESEMFVSYRGTAGPQYETYAVSDV